ncbi:uncharacterized protein AMSG_04626 [Thecamonas trahens ATCC 50062]|uniref:Uncharacterized protein n=1 Tax=Thecamonas trahens ATCC 50062 TaxID=461836 RepID=A0A0L0D9W0_THETB|nr:hypothetical protein AMSG_04626 [Thecamonas trahens ATCC 50062]KNC48881.1 hypothetical protein AMSG_04626 [Thecamonas trahens ATCC 50062]|eukprot:XP_013758301.1 hypothetical protein AMSG_04626 [Thecamonas trahens ATCC 50062]
MEADAERVQVVTHDEQQRPLSGTEVQGIIASFMASDPVLPADKLLQLHSLKAALQYDGIDGEAAGTGAGTQSEE